MSQKKSLSQKIKFSFERMVQIQLTKISPVLNTRWVYWRKMGKMINLDNPQTFSEKVNWLKLFVYHNDPLVIQCSDKFAIREYVKACRCPELLNELYGVYDHPKDIDWEKLPEKFVVKWNFGSGFNLFCTNKKTFDIKSATQKLTKWKSKNPHLYLSVIHYKHIKRKIIVEKYIEGSNSEIPEDYKLYCFNGVAKYIMVCNTRESGRTQFYFFNRDWEFCPVYRDSMYGNENFFMDKPQGIDKAIFYAENLAKPFPFVRIDFYLSDGKPILGEMTFAPSGGFDVSKAIEDPILAKERELLFGKMLDISSYKK
jgi:hypothetical protein